jgi:hypothetical protein
MRYTECEYPGFSSKLVWSSGSCQGCHVAMSLSIGKRRDRGGERVGRDSLIILRGPVAMGGCTC